MVRNKGRVCGIVSLTICMLCVVSVFARLPTGTILGVARDATGAVLPGVTVTLRNTDTGATRNVMTSETGAYRARALAVGHYEISAEPPGFSTAIQPASCEWGLIYPAFLSRIKR
jgi:hypothetical protein